MTDPTARPAETAAAEPEGATPSTPADEKTEEARIAELVETLARESADYKDKHLRALAEMENMRKRTERQIADMRHYGIAAFANDVLAVADNMHRALEAAGPELRNSTDAGVKSFIEGNELMPHDVERAKKFYDATVGWSFEAMPMPNGTYWVAKMGDKSVGGLFPMSGPDFEDMPEQWMSYVAVDDVDARMKKVTTAGATVCKEPFDVPGVGRIVILKEPGGAIVGWITPVSS